MSGDFRVRAVNTDGSVNPLIAGLATVRTGINTLDDIKRDGSERSDSIERGTRAIEREYRALLDKLGLTEGT